MTNNNESVDYYTTDQVAALLGRHPVTLRKWRTENKKIGLIKYGPPYEYRGHNLVYPKEQFAQWVSQIQMVNGVPHMNLPITANIPLPFNRPDQRATVNEALDA